MNSKINSVDSDGVYPKRRHWNNSSINWRARGLKVNDLWGVGSYPAIDTEYTFTQLSEFPHNQVNETPGGHIIEYEDTPGEERLLIRHKSGTGIDMRADGSIIISTRKNRMEYVTGDDTLIVDGDANLVYNGNLKMEVAGDWDVNVGGDFNVEVGGQKTMRVKGSEINRIEKNRTDTILENNSTKVMGNESTVVIGNRIDVTDGTYDMLVDDKAEMKFSDNLRMSSMADVNIAAENFETISNSVGVIATSGTIGGEGVQHFGDVFSGPENGGGKGTSFIGSLVGVAAEAITSRYAIYAEESWVNNGVSQYAVTASGVSNVPIKFTGTIGIAKPDFKMKYVSESQDRYVEKRPDYNMPTSDIVKGILTTTDKGIVKFKVMGDDIKNQVKLNDAYFETLLSDPNADELRNASNKDTLKAGAASRGLGSEWVVPMADSFEYDSIHDSYPANNPIWRDL